jgi:AcrR family transcriptional regulator
VKKPKSVSRPAKRRPVRELVVDAAVELIESGGVATLTLEAVAAAAGVSKGGLLHYFRSKEALLTAVIQHHVDVHEAEWLRVAGEDGPADRAREAALIQGYLRRSFSGVATPYLSARALFGIAAFNPTLLKPVKDYFRRRAQFISTRQKHPRELLAFMLMADGLSVFDALGTPPVEGALRRAVHALAQQMAATALATGAATKAARPTRRGVRDAGYAARPERRDKSIEKGN